MIPPLHEASDALGDDRAAAIVPESGEGPLALLADVTLEENASLMKELEELKSICHALNDGNPPEGLDLGQRLETLEGELLMHFASEELEEAVGTLVSDRPSFLLRASELQGEHAELLLEFDRLQEDAEGPAALEDVATGLLTFIARLEAHEHAETRFIQDLVLLEDGAGD